jgi:hypothetical protein
MNGALLTWIFAAPGQCPASDLPPAAEQSLVEMHSPLAPLLTVHAPELLGGFGVPEVPGLPGGFGVGVGALGELLAGLVGAPTSGPNVQHGSKIGNSVLWSQTISVIL